MHSLSTKKSSSLLHKTSINSTSSKTHKHPPSHKHKAIVKADKSIEEHRPSKQNLMKADKKNRSLKYGLSAIHSEVEKAFAVHRTTVIDEAQCIFSLKLLGCLTGEEGEVDKFKILTRDSQEGIDCQAFQNIYNRISKEENLANTKELFNLLSGQKEQINEQTLQQISQAVGWKGDFKNLLPNLNGTSSLTFDQFNRLTNYHNSIQ